MVAVLTVISNSFVRFGIYSRRLSWLFRLAFLRNWWNGVKSVSILVGLGYPYLFLRRNFGWINWDNFTLVLGVGGSRFLTSTHSRGTAMSNFLIFIRHSGVVTLDTSPILSLELFHNHTQLWFTGRHPTQHRPIQLVLIF